MKVIILIYFALPFPLGAAAAALTGAALAAVLAAGLAAAGGEERESWVKFGWNFEKIFGKFCE